MTVAAAEWFTKMWPRQPVRLAVAGEYLAVGAQMKLFLGDVALRGGVYGSLLGASEMETWINLGRRDLAIEIINLCNENPDRLFEVVKGAR